MLLFLDLETSGIDPKWAGILSVGACTEREDLADYYAECRLQTNESWDPKSQEVNGIPFERVCSTSKLPTFSDVAPTLLQYIEQACHSFHDKQVILVGQNVGSFDLQFLKAKWPQSLRFPFSYRTVDLHTAGYMSSGQSLNSDALSDHLCMELEPKPHNALNGVRHAREMFKRLVGLP